MTLLNTLTERETKMADLIYSRSKTHGELSLEEIQQRAPAAFAATPIEGVSERYGHYNTSDLFPMLKDFGYVPVQAAQKRPRKSERVPHAEHFISFAREQDLEITGKEGRPEIVIYNSSDKTSAAKIFGGFFRGLCSNGIVAGDGFQNKIYHGKNAIFQFEDMLKETLRRLPDLAGAIDKMRSRMLSRDQMEEFARRALSMRWKDWESSLKDVTPVDLEAGSYFTRDTVYDMMRRRRIEEVRPFEGLDLWDAFNRAQETIVRGSIDHIIQYKPKTDDAPESIKRRSPRPINSVRKSIDANRKLWDMAYELA